ncbi:hypothetical protein SCALM49S_00024 [Streptomyces californicus]
MRPVKRIGVKKTANPIRTYAEGRELTATRHKAVTALLGISAIRTVRTFRSRHPCSLSQRCWRRSP